MTEDQHLTLKANDRLVIETEHYGLSLTIEVDMLGQTITVKTGMGTTTNLTLGNNFFTVRSSQASRGGSDKLPPTPSLLREDYERQHREDRNF